MLAINGLKALKLEENVIKSLTFFYASSLLAIVFILFFLFSKDFFI